MKILKSILAVVVFMVATTVSAQQTPADKQSEVLIVNGGTYHLGNGNVITNGHMIFEDGRITAIAEGQTRKMGKIIDGTGKHIYPGFIAPAKSLGLIEVNAVRASKDEDELGEYIPNIRSIIAYNAESKVIESMRPNGVLLSQIAPQGGRISGSSTIVQFDAWNWEDAAVKIDDGIHLNWPSSFRRGRWWEGEPRGYQPNKEYGNQISELKNYVASSKAYTDTSVANEAYKAMQGLFNGDKKLYIYADGEKEIIDAVTTAKESGIQSIVIVGGYEAHKITDFLKKNAVPVLVQHTHNLPEMADDDYDFPYKLPKLLADAGVLVGLQNSGASNFQTRNLPFYAGQLVGQGMNKETALQLITGNTAKILGIDDSYGTLEVGKSATFFISKGDALDMRTNILTKAFIDGRDISLETHQTELWRRYAKKYGQE
ncbi:MAG: imidazolonepropionase-like amidohydrolase [Patiriisocius sp.]|jgi:imidazolonepropionase-like amidohydrolase